MELYLQPTQWSCVPTSFGMVLGMTPVEVIDEIGHDGSEIIYPHLPEPLCRRSFNIQECVNVAVKNMMYPVQFELEYENEPYTDVEIGNVRSYSNKDVVNHYLALVPGVLLGLDHRGKAHAVAWCRVDEMCYDPIGYKYTIDQFNPHTFIGMF